MLPFLKSSLSRVVLPMLLAAGALGAAPAQAGGVQWSIGIQLPPPPVVFYPAPPQRVYGPAPVYGRPAPEVVYVEPPRHWHHRHRHHHWRDDDRWERGGDDRWRDDRGHRGDGRYGR